MFHSFNKLHLSTPNLHQAIQGLIHCMMEESELPVRVEAAIGLFCKDKSLTSIGLHTSLREISLLIFQPHWKSISTCL